jgi:SAM-dependent methyltransferase
MTQPADALLEAHLEHPDTRPRQREFPVQGWVTSRIPLTAVWIEGDPGRPLELRPRPDVRKAFPNAPHTSGFFGVARAEHTTDGTLTVCFSVGDRPVTKRFPLASEAPEVRQLRNRKRERAYSVLICPACRARFPEGGFPNEATTVSCAACGASYDCLAGCIDLLPPEQRDGFALRNDGNISQNHYDPSALTLIHELPDGLLLDCGAGFRATEYPNVINLEVVPYASTDVLGDNQALPFADASFEGVLSLAVLEHVRDPFASARELCRVLKPGGSLLAVAPLLAPVHAYPHHYYNMTSEGLVNLFPDLEVIEKKVPESGLPIWALLWSLRSWADGLTGSARESFLNLRVTELLGDAPDYLDRDFVKGLSPLKNFELASTTLVLARKRS